LNSLACRVLPSTTSHKHEAIVPTLELFARLGLCNLDLNLNHFIEGGADVEEVRRALAENWQRVWIVSGGWCDFFDPPPKIEETFASVARQVRMARAFGARALRLFFGRLPYEDYGAAARDTIVENIRRLADEHPDIQFNFENHDGASSHPDVCREVLDGVAKPNAGLTFDPINFEHRGVDSATALAMVRPHVAHVHVKGYEDGRFCGFGEGTVDLTPILRSLVESGYGGAFTVEYEGAGDRTLHLYQSVRRAESAVNGLIFPLR
jgi:sugar phosphate isomerase/epimerase